MNSIVGSQNSPFETLYVTSKKVSCDGAKGASSHPLVYLNMGEKDFVVCPYCSKYFTIKQRASIQPAQSLKHQFKSE